MCKTKWNKTNLRTFTSFHWLEIFDVYKSSISNKRLNDGCSFDSRDIKRGDFIQSISHNCSFLVFIAFKVKLSENSETHFDIGGWWGAAVRKSSTQMPFYQCNKSQCCIRFPANERTIIVEYNAESLVVVNKFFFLFLLEIRTFIDFYFGFTYNNSIVRFDFGFCLTECLLFCHCGCTPFFPCRFHFSSVYFISQFIDKLCYVMYFGLF